MSTVPCSRRAMSGMIDHPPNPRLVLFDLLSGVSEHWSESCFGLCALLSFKWMNSLDGPIDRNPTADHDKGRKRLASRSTCHVFSIYRPFPLPRVQVRGDIL